MQSLFSAASGLNAQQKRLDTIASNIANTNTPGFKATRLDFKDALYQAMIDPVLLDPAANNLETGSGVLVGATEIDMGQGTVVETGQVLDIAVQGKGFFRVLNQNGETLYTRSGSFTLSNEGGSTYLVTPEGHYVLDTAGNKLTLPAVSSGLQISQGGQISLGDRTYGSLGLVAFANPNGLSPAGLTCYRATAESGPGVADTTSTMKQGSLERSNVDMSEEVTLLIRAQRAYSLASRAITTTDGMMGLANTMHG